MFEYKFNKTHLLDSKVYDIPRVRKGAEERATLENERQKKIESLSAMASSLQRRISHLISASQHVETSIEKNSVVEIFMNQYISQNKQDISHLSPIAEKVATISNNYPDSSVSSDATTPLPLKLQSFSTPEDKEEKREESPKLSPRSLRTQFQAEMHKYKSLVEAENQLVELNRIHQVESALIPKPELEHKSVNTSIIIMESKSVNTQAVTMESKSVNTPVVTMESRATSAALVTENKSVNTTQTLMEHKSTLTVESTFDIIDSFKPKTETKGTHPLSPFSTENKSTSTENAKVEHKSVSPISSCFRVENKSVNTEVLKSDSKSTDTSSLFLNESKSTNTISIPTESKHTVTTSIQQAHKSTNTEELRIEEKKQVDTAQLSTQNQMLPKLELILLNAITEILSSHSKTNQHPTLQSLIEYTKNQLTLITPQSLNNLSSDFNTINFLDVLDKLDTKFNNFQDDEDFVKILITEKIFENLLEDTINVLNYLYK